MSPPIATLAGVPLTAVDTVDWKLTQGTAPYMRLFECHARDVDKILAKSESSEVELFFSRNGRPLTVKGLSVLQLGPSRHPKRKSILVADRRYFWPHHFVYRWYNVRRRSGELRLVDGALQRVPPAADVTFARYSTFAESSIPWTAQLALEDVMSEVAPGKFSTTGASFSTALDIDGLVLRDSGPQAIDRVLAFVPGLAVWMDQDGYAQFTLRSGGDEVGEVAKSGPPLGSPTFPPLAVDVRLDRVRPRYIDVLFAPEDEVRFDFVDPPPTTDKLEPRALQNVLPLPDSVVIAGQKVVQNTWVEINQALLDGWNATAALVVVDGATVNLPPLTFDRLQRLWMAPGEYHAYMDASPVWARRFQTLMRHYRQTFAIPRRWVDRAHSIRFERVAITDPVNGRRAPADVYADHCTIPPVARIAFVNGAQLAGGNSFAWPFGDVPKLLTKGTLLETSKVDVLDDDVCVFRVDFRPNTAQLNEVQAVTPSVLRSSATGEGTSPSQNPAAALGAFLAHSGALAKNHRMSVVVTLGTASPNRTEGLYSVRVFPDDAKAVLPAAIARKIGPSRGPPAQLFVGPDPHGTTSARFAWRDEAATEVEQAILKGGPRSATRLVDVIHILRVANAVAATFYAQRTDRLEGRHVIAFDPARRPVGRVTSVAHGLAVDGTFTTELDMSPDPAPIDYLALLPESTRRQLFRRVQK